VTCAGLPAPALLVKTALRGYFCAPSGRLWPLPE
jgi:hypothetical protein